MFDEDVNAEFKEDKTASVEVKVGTMSANFTGTYVIDKKNLTLTLKDYKTKGVDPSMDSVAKSVLDPLKGKPFTAAYHFNKDDELAVTYKGKTDILKHTQEKS